MKKIRSITAIVLMIAVVLSLSACGSKEGETAAAAQTTAAPDYVWTSECRTIESNAAGNLTPMLFTEEGIYCSSYEKVGTREPEEGEIVSYEGQLDVYESRVYFLTYDGQKSLLEEYEPFQPESQAPEGSDSVQNSWTTGIVQGNSKDQMTIIVDSYESWSTAKNAERYSDEWYANCSSKETYYIQTIDKNGKTISAVPIDADPIEESFYLSGSGLIQLGDGSILASLDQGLLKILPDGSVEKHELKMDGWIQSLVKMNDGWIAVVYYEGNEKISILDENTLQLGTDAVPITTDGFNFQSGGGEYDLYFAGGSNCYGIHVDTGEVTKLFNWISVDVNPNDGQGFYVKDDGTVVLVSSTWNSGNQTYTNEYITLKQVPYSSVPRKQTITLATQYLDYAVQEQIIRFNREHDDVRIEVKDYSEYNTEDDYSAGETKLTTEIMAGQMPDIICFSGLPFSQIAAKGLLADQFEMIDADPELNRSDYFENILNAAATNGKLYRTVSGFSVYTQIGARSVVGESGSWNYSDVYDALKKLPEGADILDQYTTQSDVLRMLVAVQMNKLVDWNTGKCRFDTAEFAQLLEFTKNFKSEFDWDSYEWSEDEDTFTRLSKGKQLLSSAYISDPSDVMYYGFYFGGEENVAYVGYPTGDGAGAHVINLDAGMGISAKCANKEAAWEFVRTLYTEEYQSGYYSLPSNRAAFAKKLETAMTPDYQTDGKGNRILDENGEYVQNAKMTIGTASGEYAVYAMTRQAADQLTSLVESLNNVMDSNEAVLSIVEEQSKAFFAGQKTAEDVCKLIQSKASIYVAEQS